MKKLIAMLLALVMALSLAACGSTAGNTTGDDTADSDTAATASDVQYIKDKGTLIVGITEFEPMDYQDENGQWIGFDADMAKLVAEKLGVEVQFQVINWDTKFEELDGKTIDCVWNGMTLTDAVMSAMECSNAYCNNAQVVITKGALDAADAASLTYAVEAGSAGEIAATEKGYKTVPVDTQAKALMEVDAGTADAAVIDLLMAGAMVGEGTSYPSLTVTDQQLTTELYGVGCRKGSDLAAFINDVLAAAYTDGTMQEIATTYGVQESLVDQTAA